jgi:hypothetical protein
LKGARSAHHDRRNLLQTSRASGLGPSADLDLRARSKETSPVSLFKSLSSEDENLLEEWGFDHDPCEAYTRLDAWVGAFAVRDIQERLPNCGISRDHGVVLTRPIVKNRRSKRVASAVRFLFGINWADSAPGLSWPADYHLTWLPGFDRWVLTYSADSPDAMGYCDFALGAFGADDDWREAVREILVADWRFQFAEWDQAPWAYVWRPGLVTEREALA